MKNGLQSPNRERTKRFKRYVSYPRDRVKNIEFANFSTESGDFAEYVSVAEWYVIDLFYCICVPYSYSFLCSLVKDILPWCCFCNGAFYASVR